MTIKDETSLQRIFKRTFEKTHRDGLLQGSRAMCSIVLKKVRDTTKTSEERLRDIESFCVTSLPDNNKQKGK